MAKDQNNQTNENKATASKGKKPTVTKTTVTKKTSAGKTDTTENKISVSKTSTNKVHTTDSRNNTKKPNTNSSRTGIGKSSTTGSKNNTGRSSTAGSKTGGAKTQQQNNHKRKKKSGLSGGQKTIIVASVFGILMAIIITCIMRGSLLSTTQIAGEYYLDTNFDIYNFVEPKNEKAYLVFDNASFQPDGIGDYEIEYTVQCGKLKTKKTITIHVADADTPMISGPDELTVLVGDEIRWADHYQVIDSQPGLEESIVSSNTIDTSQSSIQSTTLSVVDWYNNSSTKDIQVIVLDLQGEFYYAAKAARQYKLDLGISTSSSELYVYTSEENITYVLAASDSVYTFDEDGNCSVYEYDSENETESSAFADLVTTIITDGKIVDAFSISDFIVN